MWDKRPADWDVKRLSEITEPITRRNDGRDHPVMTISAKHGFMLQSDKYSREMAGQSLGRYTLLKRGEFAYNKGNSLSSPQGCIFRLERESAVIPFVYYCFRIKNELDATYASHAFRAGVLNRELARSINSGVRNDGLLNLAATDFFRCHIAIPSLQEQRAIAEVISAVSDAAGRTQSSIHALQDLKNAFLEVELSRLSTMQRVSFRRLRDVAQVRTGIAKSEDRKVSNPISVNYLRVANVQDGYLDLRELKTITIEKAQLERYRLLTGDVLFNEGGDYDKLGRGCVWKGEVPNCIHQNHVFAVRCGHDMIPHFLALQAASRRGKAYFRMSSKQTTNLASINTSDLKSFPVLVPPLSEQAKLAEVAQAFDDRVAKEKQSLAELINLRSALAQELLSGRIRLPQSMIDRHRTASAKAA